MMGVFMTRSVALGRFGAHRISAWPQEEPAFTRFRDTPEFRALLRGRM
jgi:hypothetical protein